MVGPFFPGLAMLDAGAVGDAGEGSTVAGWRDAGMWNEAGGLSGRQCELSSLRGRGGWRTGRTYGGQGSALEYLLRRRLL